MNILVPKSPPPRNAKSTLSVEDVEAALSQWFDAHVVLTSSGRAATLLLLQELGFKRYTHRVAIPRLIARCVIDSVSNAAFPVDAAKAHTADATILFHQYGFTQTLRPKGIVIEDCAHAFFGTPLSGARAWAGKYAIFSMPKFFSTASPVGGIIVQDVRVAKNLRARRDAVPPKPSAILKKEGKLFRETLTSDRTELELLYFSRLFNPNISPEELGGLPKSVAEIKEIGRRRLHVLDSLLEAAESSAVPAGWEKMLREKLPYALPIQKAHKELVKIDTAMKAAGVATDLYQIDINRNMFKPKYEQMLLIPYSHLVPDNVLKDMVSILRSRR